MEIRKRLQNNPMDVLAARSRRIFCVFMLKHPIPVLKQTELLGHQFTVYGTAENPLFLAKEVAECIDYAKTSQGYYDVSRMVGTVDKEEKYLRTIFVDGRNYEMWFLTEDGLYEVLMQSRKPIAKQFKKGVKQILHEVRTTGGYIATKADDTPEEIMARALTIAQATLEKREERLKQLEADNAAKDETISIQAEQIKESAPKVKVYNDYISSSGTYTATQIAKEYGWGAETLNRKLKEMGIQYKQNGQWLLYAKYDGNNYTRSIPRTYTKSDGVIGTQMQTVWTSKGREFIHEILPL